MSEQEQPDLHVGPAPEQAQPVGPAPESALVGQVPVQEAPATGVPLTGASLPADGVMREVTLDAAPNPEAVAATNEKLNTRITAKFAYERVTVVVRKLLEIADVPAGTITGDERLVSMISFEDEPLRFCLERLRHLVSGVCSVNAYGAVDFESFAVEVTLS